MPQRQEATGELACPLCLSYWVPEGPFAPTFMAGRLFSGVHVLLK